MILRFGPFPQMQLSAWAEYLLLDRGKLPFARSKAILLMRYLR